MKHKQLLINLIFAVVVLGIAGGWFAWRAAHRTGAAALAAALTYGDANTVLDLPLTKDATYDVDTGYYTVHIEVNDRAARFIDSPCPDHICENYGWISMEDQTAICAPAHAVLMIVPVSTS